MEEVVDRLARIEQLLSCQAVVDPDTESLQRENARLLTLLRSHPPPRPPMLPNRRLRLAARNKWRCHACEELLSEAFDIDHAVPWCETFDDSDANCVPLHVECHRAKCSAESSARVRRREPCVPAYLRAEMAGVGTR